MTDSAAENLDNEELENEDLENEDLENDPGDEGPDEETISLAKSMGWVDEDKFRGDKSRWVDADAFVEKGMNDLPVLRERLRNQSKQLSDMETDISAFKQHHEDSLNREYSRAQRDIEEKKAATVEEGDTEEYARLQKASRDLAMAHARSQPVQPSSPSNPLYEDWKKDNSDWFEADTQDGKEMTAYAQRMSDFIAETKPELIGKQGFLDEIESEVKSRFKDRFENPRRQESNSVESGGRQHRRPGSRTYANLPAEAKAACDRFVRRGLVTKEQYVQDYEW